MHIYMYASVGVCEGCGLLSDSGPHARASVRVVECCSVLQCVAVLSVLQCVAVYVAVCCSVCRFKCKFQSKHAADLSARASVSFDESIGLFCMFQQCIARVERTWETFDTIYFWDWGEVCSFCSAIKFNGGKAPEKEKKIREKKTTFGWLFSGISSWDEKGRLRGEEKEWE